MDVWRGIVKNWIIVAAIMLASLMLGVLASYLPESKYQVVARIIPVDAQDVQKFSSSLGLQGILVVPLEITNVETLNVHVGGPRTNTVDNVTNQLFNEYLRNLDSDRLKKEFASTQQVSSTLDLDKISEAVSEITYRVATAKNTPLSVVVTMRSRIGDNRASSLLNEYLDYVINITKEEMVAFIVNKQKAENNSTEIQEIEFTVDDLEVVSIDLPALPPEKSYFPNRKLIVTAFVVFGLVLSVLVTIIIHFWASTRIKQN